MNNMTQQRMLELNQSAITLMNGSRFEEASHHWEELLRFCPNWEHGIGAYSLAVCYEEANRFSDAEAFFLEALRQEPNNEYFLGGYGSFLYLQKKNEKAFEIYKKLFVRAKVTNDFDQERSIMPALLELGARLGFTQSQVQTRLVDP